jgi:hypothetical protein
MEFGHSISVAPTGCFGSYRDKFFDAAGNRVTRLEIHTGRCGADRIKT